METRIKQYTTEGGTLLITAEYNHHKDGWCRLPSNEVRIGATLPEIAIAIDETKKEIDHYQQRKRIEKENTAYIKYP